MRKSIFVQSISGLLILLFLYTAFSKWLDFKSFRQVLMLSPLIGRQAHWLAYLIPFTESCVALFLFFPLTRMLGLYASAIILLGFTSYIGYMLFYAEHLPCSCGGVIRQLSWRQHLLFNIFFLLLSVVGIGLEWKRTNPVHPGIPVPSRADVS